MDVAHGSLKHIAWRHVSGFVFVTTISLRSIRIDTSTSYLRQVSVADVDLGHAFEPGAPELRCAGIRVGEAVLQVYQHLRVLLMLLHL